MAYSVPGFKAWPGPCDPREPCFMSWMNVQSRAGPMNLAVNIPPAMPVPVGQDRQFIIQGLYVGDEMLNYSWTRDFATAVGTVRWTILKVFTHTVSGGPPGLGDERFTQTYRYEEVDNALVREVITVDEKRSFNPAFLPDMVIPTPPTMSAPLGDFSVRANLSGAQWNFGDAQAPWVWGTGPWVAP